MLQLVEEIDAFSKAEEESEARIVDYYQARARARRACALRALGLLLADGTPTVHNDTAVN